MGAGFEGDIGGRPPRPRPGAAQRLGFRMGPAAGLGPAAADHLPVLHQHAAHRGVGPGVAEAAAGPSPGGAHELEVSDMRNAHVRLCGATTIRTRAEPSAGRARRMTPAPARRMMARPLRPDRRNRRIAPTRRPRGRISAMTWRATTAARTTWRQHPRRAARGRKDPDRLPTTADLRSSMNSTSAATRRRWRSPCSSASTRHPHLLDIAAGSGGPARSVAEAEGSASQHRPDAGLLHAAAGLTRPGGPRRPGLFRHGTATRCPSASAFYAR